MHFSRRCAPSFIAVPTGLIVVLLLMPAGAGADDDDAFCLLGRAVLCSSPLLCLPFSLHSW